MSTFWNSSRVSLLRRYRNEGLSARSIGAKLGASRNSVLGKLHRLGVPVLTAIRKAKPTKEERKPAPPLPAPAPATKFKFLPAGSVSEIYMSLSADNCRWPEGDPASDDFTFCASKKHKDQPYCEAHCKIAYNNPVMRARK